MGFRAVYRLMLVRQRVGCVGGGALIGDSRVVAGVIAIVGNYHPAAIWEVHKVLALSAIASTLLRVAKGCAMVVV